MSDLTEEQIEEARAALRKTRSEGLAEQRQIDLSAILEIESERGPENISVVKTSFTPGLVTCVAVRTPSSAEMKRYRYRVRPKDDGPADSVAAAEELAKACLVYPSPEEYAKLCSARPGISALVGLATLQLSTGRAAEEGKG